MSYDLHAQLGGELQGDVDALIRGEYRGVKIAHLAARIRLLTGVAARNENVKDYAVGGDRKRGGGYKSLVHGKGEPENAPYTRELIIPVLKQMENLGIGCSAPDLRLLPPASWFLQFTFTLAKPWISKDDDPFYVAESVNPVRKDKVFKVPLMSAASWKGLLRWTLMHTCLTLQKDSLSPERFAAERFVQTLLFGNEQGEELAQAKGFAKYVDTLKPEAVAEYEHLLRRYYGIKPDEPLPHHSGRLMFYPTFFDLIDVEVINPHSRETKAGTHPIYLECVPAAAKGTFSLLYAPFDCIGQEEVVTHRQAAADLLRITKGLQAMFLTYGFSAKRTSGYGTAKENVEDGYVQIRIEETNVLPVTPPPAAEQQLPKYLQVPGKLKDEYLNPDGTFHKHNEAELKAMKKADRQEYGKAKRWWEREGKALNGTPAAPPASAEPAQPVPQWLTRPFASFDELIQVSQAVAGQLAQEVKDGVG